MNIHELIEKYNEDFQKELFGYMDGKYGYEHAMLRLAELDANIKASSATEQEKDAMHFAARMIQIYCFHTHTSSPPGGYYPKKEK